MRTAQHIPVSDHFIVGAQPMKLELANAGKRLFKNTSLLMVYYEAIANALDAGATEIQLHMRLDNERTTGSFELDVLDNGSGFTDEDFHRFCVLWNPRDKYHQGQGRLIYLEYFERVEVDTRWGQKRRSFVFNKDFKGESAQEELSEPMPSGASFKFRGFGLERFKTNDDIRPSILKSRILEHFLPTFIALQRDGKQFKITLKLDASNTTNESILRPEVECITLQDIPVLTSVDVEDATQHLLDRVVMHYLVKPTSKPVGAVIGAMIDGRTSPLTLFSSSAIPQGYQCIFLFELYGEGVRADNERQDLIWEEHLKEKHFKDAARRAIQRVLLSEIPSIQQRNQKVEKEITETFPHLLGYLPATTVGLIDKNESLDAARNTLFTDQKRILTATNIDDETYEKSLELSSRALTEYILYREKIIQRIEATTHKDTEDILHDLIVPRRTIRHADELAEDLYENNIWLFDDKFMTFRTLLSDREMDDFIQAIHLDDEKNGERGRPDIAMVFSEAPQTAESVDVVVIEIKRKTDNEKENLYTVSQLLERARKLAQYYPKINRMWFYGVININDEMAASLRQQSWAPLYSKGKVYYREHLTERLDETKIPTPTVLLPFDALVTDARARNHTFLKILKDGMKKYSQQRPL